MSTETKNNIILTEGEEAILDILYNTKYIKNHSRYNEKLINMDANFTPEMVICIIKQEIIEGRPLYHYDNLLPYLIEKKDTEEVIKGVQSISRDIRTGKYHYLSNFIDTLTSQLKRQTYQINN